MHIPITDQLFRIGLIFAGNHDLTLDRALFPQGSQDPSRSISLFSSSRSLTYLCHESATIRLVDPKGPRTEFKVFGSPYSPRCGPWAFSYDRPETPPASQGPGPATSEIWREVPSDVDILVTHTPAQTHCDACPTTKQPLGCEDLRLTLHRVRPRLHVCGHIHHGRGSEHLRWGMDSSDSPTVEPWLDPSPDPKSGKMSLVDLASRGDKRPLDLGTTRGPALTLTASEPALGRVSPPESVIPADARGQFSGRAVRDKPGIGSVEHASTNRIDGGTSAEGFSIHPADAMVQDWLVRINSSRHETCVVNCAIVATKYPHTGGKRLNKPIVVDVDLPVWG